MSAVSEHDRLLELAALGATEGLDAAEERELCASADGRRLARELALAAAALHVASLGHGARAPEGVESRLLARAVQPPRAPGQSPRQGSRLGSRRGSAPLAEPEAGAPFVPQAGRPAGPLVWAGWVAAAAAAVLCVVLARQLAGLEERLHLGDPAVRRDRLVAEAPDVATLDWTPLTDPSAQGLAGRVTWSDARNEGYMTFRGLAANDPKVEQYQLWIFRGTDLGAEPYPVDGGVFDVASAGEAVVPIDPKLLVGRAGTFVVTVEPPGGVVVSDRSKLVALAQRAI
ncbi:MAG: anti-sigma factor [Planctomycetota bacterium]